MVSHRININMAAQDIFSKINTAGETEKSIQWYQAQIKTLGSITPRRLMSNAPDMTSFILPGAMYMFIYDAKLKEKLPYWDSFPLVLPFRKVEDGFYGINLHYLPYIMRMKLLKALHEYTTNEKMDETTRLRLSWSLLNSSTRFGPVKACVKHYLFDHIESRFLRIKYPDWVTAAMLPVERFHGADKNTVWRNTRKKL